MVLHSPPKSLVLVTQQVYHFIDRTFLCLDVCVSRGLYCWLLGCLLGRKVCPLLQAKDKQALYKFGR